VDSKRYYKDWVGDLIIGGIGEGAVLTLVEQKTKHCLMYPPPEGKRSDEVMIAMIIALRPFIGKIGFGHADLLRSSKLSLEVRFKRKRQRIDPLIPEERR